jgi:AMP nucleosidase
MVDAKLDKDAIDQINQYSRDRVGLSTLERYTGSSANEFQPFILLTNFNLYVDLFAKNLKEPIHAGSVMHRKIG